MVQVPLVVYENGERRVVGKADVDVDTGEVDCVVEDEKLQQQLAPDANTFSFIASAGNLEKIPYIYWHPPSYLDNFGGTQMDHTTEIVGHPGHNPVQHRDGKPPWCRTCGLTANFEKPESEFKNSTNDPEDFQYKVKQAVVDHYNGSHDIREAIGFESVYIVWFAKTLQNWKALLSTTLPDGMYYEVTRNGDRNETYLDAYKKVENVTFRDPL